MYSVSYSCKPFLTMDNQILGKFGEDMAEKFLIKNGYRIREKNFLCRLGEIDIVAQDKETICFVEVKMRSNTTFGFPEDSIQYYKIKKIIKAAKYYINYRKLFTHSFRFDVVHILNNAGRFEIGLIKNAFDGGGNVS